MSKKIKYFSIWGKNLDTGKKEKLDDTTSLKDCLYLLHEYRLSFGRNWQIFCPQLQDY